MGRGEPYYLSVKPPTSQDERVCSNVPLCAGVSICPFFYAWSLLEPEFWYKLFFRVSVLTRNIRQFKHRNFSFSLNTVIVACHPVIQFQRLVNDWVCGFNQKQLIK